MSDSPAVLLYDAAGNPLAVADGVAIPANTTGLLIMGSDGTNARRVKTAADGTVRVDPSGTTAQPITDNGGSITVDGTVAVSGTIPVSGPLTDAQLRATPVPVSGTVTANAGTGPWPVTDNGGSLTVDGPLTDTQLRAAAVPVSAASLPLPTGAATETTLAGIKTGTDKIPTAPSQEHITADSPHATRLTDGTSFYKATTPGDTQPVSGPLTDVQLRALAVPVSGTMAISSLPAGSPTDQRSVDMLDVMQCMLQELGRMRLLLEILTDERVSEDHAHEGDSL